MLFRVVARVHSALSVEAKSDVKGHGYVLSYSLNGGLLGESIGDG